MKHSNWMLIYKFLKKIQCCIFILQKGFIRFFSVLFTVGHIGNFSYLSCFGLIIKNTCYMCSMTKKSISRRRFIRTTAGAFAGLTILPHLGCTRVRTGPMKRILGRIGHEVTTLGLGGQASIQWTPEGVDPVRIILKAFNLGVNYFDTSNVYGPSQTNYGKAFRVLNLLPGLPGYDESLRRSIFLTTKTHLRWAKGGREMERVRNSTNGKPGSGTIDDVKRSLSQMFGDGEGNYPEGAYLDMVLIHNLNTLQEVDVLYEGVIGTDPQAEHIGALAALRDYRDGTNLTGLNPGEEKLIRHIGFSGHYSAPVMMEMIRRDRENLLDGMLVAVNANDKLYLNMQHNVIPVARAKNLGIIAMKVFADGAMYDKDAHWSYAPGHVVRKVGSPSLPSAPLIRYSLTVPGVHTAIIGIGYVDDDPSLCQLEQNFRASQVTIDGLNGTERKEIEQMAARVKEGKTNYFQIAEGGLTAVTGPTVTQVVQDGNRTVHLAWNTAYAGDEPIKEYQLWRDREKIMTMPFTPQVTNNPWSFDDLVYNTSSHSYRIVTVDGAGRQAETEPLIVPSI